jgi:hypothetical protein
VRADGLASRLETTFAERGTCALTVPVDHPGAMRVLVDALRADATGAGYARDTV